MWLWITVYQMIIYLSINTLELTRYFFIVENANSQNPEQSNGNEIRIDLLIPLVISVLCFLLSLGIIIYQRRLIQNNKRQLRNKYEANSEHSHHSKFGTYSIRIISLSILS